MVTRNIGDMALLRILVIGFEAAAGALLYFAVVRAWGDRLAAAVAVALYQFIPLGFDVVTVGNLTNAFAQALAVFALVIMAAPGLRLEKPVAVAGLTIVMSAAFMSHTSTFALLLPAAFLVAMSFAWKGGPALKSPAAAVALGATVAALIAFALYYRHFGEIYRAEWTRISAETAANAPDAGGRTAVDRLVDVPRQLNLMFGLPVLFLTAIGVFHLVARSARDRLALTLLGWTVSCVMFFIIGVITPVDMRYYLAAIPAVAIAAAAGASWMWTTGGTGRGAALVLLVGAALIGVAGVLRF
jgi:hypothetical protein